MAGPSGQTTMARRTRRGSTLRRSAALQAVITGDVVRSRTLPSEARMRLEDHISGAFSALRSRYDASLPYPVAIFSGDSWQAYVQKPGEAIRIGVHLYCSLVSTHQLRSRMAIAVNTVDFLNEENLSASDGEAFRQSGLALREMAKDARFAISLPGGIAPIFEHALDEVIDVCNHLARDWTQGQAQAVSLRLLYPEASQKELAEKWTPHPIKQPAVSQFLSAAHWDLLEATLERSTKVIDLMVTSQ